MQFYVERETIRRDRAPALHHSPLRHGIKRRIDLDQVDMLRIPARPLPRRQFFRIPTLDKTGIRPTRGAHKNFSAHTSTKSRRAMKANAGHPSPRAISGLSVASSESCATIPTRDFQLGDPA